MVDIAKGKYERTDAENYDEFLKALDVNFLLRKAATASTPVMEVKKTLQNIIPLNYNLNCHWLIPTCFTTIIALSLILGDRRGRRVVY